MSEPQDATPGPRDNEKQRDVEKQSVVIQSDEDYKDLPDHKSSQQDGVAQVQAITSMWTKKMLWTTLVLVWFVSFCLAMLASVQYALTPYITSSFSQHGLLATINIAGRVISGVLTLAIAKFIDIRGRLDGFAGAVFLTVIGMIMKGFCQNVETLAAAEVFLLVGSLAVGFILDVFIADITTLRNRVIVFSLNSTPFLITTFAGPRIAELFYYYANFRWAFVAFAIILAVASIPVIAVLWIQQNKAKAAGLIRPKSGRTYFESLKFHTVQFDVLGMVLISAGFTLLLLPFSLVSAAGGRWDSPHIIIMLVFGLACLAAFGAWEKYFSPVMFFPFALLKDRTVMGASVTYFIVFLTTYIWNGYYSSYLQVVHDMSISVSNYVLNCYSLTAYFTGPFIGLYIRYYGHVKYPALAAIPIYILGTALVIYFRTPGTSVGYVAMCQVLVGFAVGLLTNMAQLALMASVRQENVAVALAIYGLFGSMGSSTGYAIAGGMWTNILPYKMMEFLPEDSKADAWAIYGDITKQLADPIGTPIRDAIILAYGDVARKMVIVSAALIPLLIVSVCAWRNINVKDLEEEEKQEKGTVF